MIEYLFSDNQINKMRKDIYCKIELDEMFHED